jgi:hypothetical protein
VSERALVVVAALRARVTELEAENAELRAALGRRDAELMSTQAKLLRALIAAERRGRPRKAPAEHGKRHARWLRAKKPTLRDQLLYLDELMRGIDPEEGELRITGWPEKK